MRDQLSLKTLLLIGMALVAAACSLESEVCGEVCDCEHCNDYEEDVSCAMYDQLADVADAYGCDGEWEDYLTCVRDEGSCNEEEARWEMSAPGRCNGTYDTGVDCTTVPCTMPSATCQGGTCIQTVCEGTTSSCDTDEDCSDGQSLCATQAEAIDECVTAASGRDAHFFMDLD